MRWVALTCVAALALAGIQADVAGAKNKRVGSYEGTLVDSGVTSNELGGTISFRYTKQKKIVGFTVKDIPRQCFVGGVEKPFGTASFSAPKMSVQGAAKFFYSSFSTLPGQSGQPVEIRVSGKPDSQRGPKSIQGKVFQYDTTVAGTDGSCTTGEPEWTAKKVKK